MPGYMSAAAARDFYDRATRPRPSHVTPELTAALVADLEEQIHVTRESASGMMRQGWPLIAAFMFGEVARFGKHRDFCQGTRKEGKDALQSR